MFIAPTSLDLQRRTFMGYTNILYCWWILNKHPSCSTGNILLIQMTTF